MKIKYYNSRNASLRNRSVIVDLDLNKIKPEKSLTFYYKKANGRNGKITTRHRGGGAKRLYRVIGKYPNINYNQQAIVCSIEYDPNRSSRIALVQDQDGTKKYILAPLGLKVGSIIFSGMSAPISIGNTLPIKSIPIGTQIHNIESQPNRGGTFAKSAGTFAQIISKDQAFITIRLPSGAIQILNPNCIATIGQIGNILHNAISIGTAGRSRHMNIRPKVRGVAKNAADHPHGGGEGKSPIGHTHPLTPWGKPALGVKTRKKNKTIKYY